MQNGLLGHGQLPGYQQPPQQQSFPQPGQPMQLPHGFPQQGLPMQQQQGFPQPGLAMQQHVQQQQQQQGNTAAAMAIDGGDYGEASEGEPLHLAIVHLCRNVMVHSRQKTWNALLKCLNCIFIPFSL